MYAINVRDRLIILCENILLLGQLARAQERIIEDDRITFLNVYQVCMCVCVCDIVGLGLFFISFMWE